MKKSLAVLLCLSLMLFSGCSAEGGESSSQPETSSGSTESGSSQEEPQGGASAASDSEDAAVQEMMDALAGYQPGTAGSSLKVYIAACGLLNYSEQYVPEDEEALRSGLKEYLASADELALESILQGQQDVQAAAASILEEGGQSLEGVLADAGNPNRYDQYDPQKYEQVLQILTEALSDLDSAG